VSYTITATASNSYTAYYEIWFEESASNTGSNGAQGNPIGDYWKDELADGIAKIEANRKKTDGGLSEFFFLTDAHWPDNAGYSPALINYLAEKINAEYVVFCGDIIRRYNETKENAINNEILAFYNALEAYTKVGETLKIMTTLGNHDRNYSVDYPNDTLTEREAYDLFTKRMEGWGVVRGDGDSTASYYDDTQNKVRYVQFFFTSSSVDLPENRFIEGALAWAEDRIKELDSEWTVIVMTHGFLPSKGVTIASMESDEKEIAKALLRIKSEARAELACWLVGHNHIDRNEVLQSADRQTRLPVISCASDGYPKDEYLNSIQEQSFSFMQVDTANKKIYLTRIGRGSDQVIRYDSGISATYTFE
jgi:predicted phosphodiesterase